MPQYLLFRTEATSEHSLADLGARALELGVVVVGAFEGRLLVQADADDVAQILREMPGWDFAPSQATTTLWQGH